MLDLHIYVGNRFRHTGLLDYRLHCKDTAIWVPLSPNSNHHPATHRGWPVDMMRRIDKRCTSKDIARREKQALAHRLLKRGINVFPVHADLNSFSDLSDPIQNLPCIRPPTSVDSRVVLPFHSVWHSAGIASFLRAQSVWVGMVGGAAKIGLAWKKGGRHMVQTLRSVYKEEHSDPETVEIFNY